MGSIYKRGSTYWIKYYRAAPGGKRVPVRESARSPRLADARALLREREGAPVTRVVHPERYTFDEAIQLTVEDYRANGRRSLSTIRGQIDNHLLPAWSGQVLLRLGEAEFVAYQNRRQAEGATNATINRELAVVGRAFSLAVRAGKVASRPRIPRLAENNVRTGFFEEAQFRAVQRRLPPVYADLAEFAFLTGWRWRSEIAVLQWRHVDWEAGRVRLDPGMTKNREGRVFPLTAQLRAVLERCRARRLELTPWIFHRNGERIRSFRKVWLRVCREAGVPGRLMHDFRRTAVRNLEARRVPRAVAMKLTGHRTESTYRRYAIVSEADLETAVRLLDTERDSVLHSDACRSTSIRARSAE